MKRDASSPSEAELSTSTEIESAGRERSDDTRDTMGGAVAERGGGTVVEYEPVDEEELGVTRRHFFNLSLLTVVGFSVTGFGAACLAFLWPLQNQGGFGGQVNIGKEKDILNGIASYPGIFYASAARAYIVPFPNDNPVDLAKAKKVYKPAIYQNMSQLGLVALYQRCVHLGCRVPFCKSSQWFECPCHGSKYSQVGEKKAGPRPRARPLLHDAGRRLARRRHEQHLPRPADRHQHHEPERRRTAVRIERPRIGNAFAPTTRSTSS